MTEYRSDLFFGALTGNGRVLVVDDEPSVRTVVRMTLEKAGYDVLEAENGEKAIEAINTGENRLVLDTVICDIRMPKINGIQAIDYFQRVPPCSTYCPYGLPGDPAWPFPSCGMERRITWLSQSKPRSLRLQWRKRWNDDRLLGRDATRSAGQFLLLNFRRIHHYGDDVGALYEVGSSIFSSAG